MLKEQFSKTALSRLWVSTLPSKPVLAKETLKALLPFATMYLCEQGFSTLTVVKTKYRNALQPADDMRCALTQLTPNFDALSAMKQNQIAH